MKRAGTNLRYFQKTTDRLPAMRLHVDVVPMPDGDKPESISVMDGNKVVGTLTIEEMAAAMARYEKLLLPA